MSRVGLLCVSCRIPTSSLRYSFSTLGLLVAALSLVPLSFQKPTDSPSRKIFEGLNPKPSNPQTVKPVDEGTFTLGSWTPVSLFVACQFRTQSGFIF